MSLINNMLKDLDRRQALGAGADTGAVRTPAAKPRQREWFWHTLAGMMMVSVAWVGWVAYQVVPRPVATKLALQFGDEARARQLARVPAPVNPPLAAQAAPAPAAPASPPVQFDTFRLAHALETPVREPRPIAAPPPEEALIPDEPKPAAPSARPPKSETIKPEPATTKGSVDKRNRPASEITTGHFRRAVVLLNQGRVAEAEHQLAEVLQVEPSHATARQVYVALLLEQQRVEAARRLLQEGLALTPTHREFALALARIHTEQREYAAALEVMNKAGAAAGNSDFQALRGAVLQRLARHAEAVEAYQLALRGAPQAGTSWLGLAISLDALGRRAQAAEAYRRALGAGALAAEAREYAESRARALQ